MPSFTEIANDFAKAYLKAKNKNYALNQMIFEINYLSDPKSNQPLDFKSKSDILKLIHQYLSGQKKFNLDDGEIMEPEFKDITIFFEKKKLHLKAATDLQQTKGNAQLTNYANTANEIA